MKKIILSLIIVLCHFSLWSNDFYLEQGHLYKQTEAGGTLVTTLPQRQIYPFNGTEPILLTSLAQVDANTIYVTSPFRIYKSIDAGQSWTSIVYRSQFGRWAYLTAIAIDSQNRIAIGTSFHGLYLSDAAQKKWTDHSEHVPGLSSGAGYFDDIDSLVFDGQDNLYMTVRLGSELYKYNVTSFQFDKLKYTLNEQIRGLSWKEGLRFDTDWGHYGYADGEATKLTAWDKGLTLTAEEKARRALANDKAGLYLSAWQASAHLDEHIAFAKSHGLNAIVIDFKDDLGRVTYNSKLPMVKDTKALYSLLDIDTIVAKTKAAGLYLIGRVVVFKDPKLYAYDNNKYALWDETRKAPWGHFIKVKDEETGEDKLEQREFWVDEYSEEVWDYNIAIAKEMEAAGVSEIQFDYIRFPSEGPTQNITFRYQKSNMDYMDALESFLKKSRENISIPIGTDVFGFNGWYVMDYLGQNIQRISSYVDVISPMTYPSHFNGAFMRGEESYNEWGEKLYFTGVTRAKRIVNNKALIRPYVQSFLIYKELKMEEPEYTDYLYKQLTGNKKAGAGGFLLWNASGRYYMVKKDLSEYHSQTK
ncbi:putative glycoside hydrolase [Spirochaeta cellobiosiphila]|uniref:putative glycoside hydrolase n=1 Tax=Spirochaeta cellobiosiphila TaxID=504483 RepID=UPI00069F8635|nr:putative glycoside hydrolase [Spirochaeta cellobiosiphila]